MKKDILILSAFLLSSPLYAHDYGYFSLCVYKQVPNSSEETQVYKFEANPDNSQCMEPDAEHATFTVSIPPNGEKGMYCSENEIKFENRWHRCLSYTSYVGFKFTGEGGGASASTSGAIRFYAPANKNEVWYQGGVDKTMKLCLGQGKCDSTDLTFHNGNHVSIIYEGDE